MGGDRGGMLDRISWKFELGLSYEDNKIWAGFSKVYGSCTYFMLVGWNGIFMYAFSSFCKKFLRFMSV